jgi:hypothetical protein
VWIPKSATTKPGALIQNGHGLLGLRHEGGGGYLTSFASKYGYVAFSVDWTGMASDDAPVIADITSGDISRFAGAVERQHQGHLNAILAMRMMRGRFARDPAVMFDGKSAIDPSLRFYRGDSQGGIFGGVYMALSTDVTRGLLSVAGAPYSMLLDRSADFTAFRFLIGLNYTNAKEAQIVMEIVQMLWDRTEPGGWMGPEPLPGTPRKDLLFHVAIGDHQVSPLGAHWMARTVGAKLMTPAARPIWGLPEQPYPFEGSGLVEFDTQQPEAPKTNRPPSSDVDPHNIVRSLDAAQKMADTFFRTGRIEGTCDGRCDPVCGRPAPGAERGRREARPVRAAAEPEPDLCPPRKNRCPFPCYASPVEPADLTVKILQDIRQEIAELRRESSEQNAALRADLHSFESITVARFEVIETTLRDLAQQLVILGRGVKVAIDDRHGTAGRFDALEQRVTELERKVG